MKIALNDEKEFEYIQTDYNFYSEFSHLSTYVVNNESEIKIKYIKQLLHKSIDISLYIMELYIGWLLDKTAYQNSPISYQKTIIHEIRKKLFNYEDTKKTFQEYLNEM